MMKVSRARISLILAVAFLVVSAIVPRSSDALEGGGYFAMVGWVMLLVVTPVLWVLEHRARA